MPGWVGDCADRAIIERDEQAASPWRAVLLSLEGK
jgi:hypothetical protein